MGTYDITVSCLRIDLIERLEYDIVTFLEFRGIECKVDFNCSVLLFRREYCLAGDLFAARPGSFAGLSVHQYAAHAILCARRKIPVFHVV